MAQLNLIQGAFTGVLGQLQGQHWKGKHIVKSRCFSKQAANGEQKAALTAFTILCRVSATVVASSGDAFKLDTRKMHPHNALAHKWKDAVRDHRFDLGRVLTTFKSGGFWKLSNATFDVQTRRIEFQFDPFTGRKPEAVDYTYILVYNNEGVRIFEYYGTRLEQNTALLTDVPDARGNLVLSFTTSHVYGPLAAYDASIVKVV